MTLTAQSDVDRLGRVLLMHARDAWPDAAAAEGQWQGLDWTSAPERLRAVDDYDVFVGHLRALGAEPMFLPASPGATLDAIYPRDASVVCRDGVILCRPGKPARREEPALHRRFLESRGIPVIGGVSEPGTLEGGDVVWLDGGTLAVGQGDRTNPEGIAQLREILGGRIDDLIVVPLPDYRATGDVFHLMSVFSPIAPDLALVYAPLLPDPFRRTLLDRGFDLVEVPDDEFETLGTNVLAVSPRVCLMLEGNPVTRKRLEKAGAEVHAFDGTEICLKGCGGPTCLTRPLVRNA